MDNALNFTQTFSHGVEWPWPIAVYLLLAGMSGGAILIALLIKHYKKQEENTALFKSASLVSFVTILLGMVCLVGDLARPLYFWKILINYNFSSVMSIGVAALCIYIPLTFIMCLYALESEILGFLEQKFENLVGIFKAIMKILAKFSGILKFLTMIFAVVICAYTGFLISVLVRFPILNTAVLPGLFIASGLSAGIAGSSLLAVLTFKEDRHSSDIKLLHKIETPTMIAEILFIFMIFVSLILGNAGQKAASVAFYSGFYASFFWIMIVGVGFVVPSVLSFIKINDEKTARMKFIISASASIIGVLALRYFILYAGQSYGI